MRVAENVLRVLSECEVQANTLKLPGQLDRPMYVAVNKVLEAAGWAWNRKSKLHLCTGGQAIDVLDQVLLTGEVILAKQEFGAFYTPPSLAADLVLISDVSGKRCLEPSAGHGAIAREIVAQGGEVDCIELLPDSIQVLREWGGYSAIACNDFLTINAEVFEKHGGLYDRIVMNPPFARQDDIRHVLHAWMFLKPGGRLVAIMSAGVLYRDSKLNREFNALVAASDGRVTTLPEGSFKSSGTMVNTVYVVLNK